MLDIINNLFGIFKQFKIKEENMQLSEHFRSEEFECTCGCHKSEMKQSAIEMLEEIRAYFGNKPIKVHSGYRCEKKQKQLIAQRLTKTLNSQHREGLAVDLHADFVDLETLHKGCGELQEQGIIDGLGLYNWGVHVDKRGYKAFWKKP